MSQLRENFFLSRTFKLISYAMTIMKREIINTDHTLLCDSRG